jgi:small-conductance mechanosensitive channel
MSSLFEENLTDTKHRGHSEHNCPARKRSRIWSAVFFTIVFTVLWQDTPLVHSTEESPERASVEKKIEEIKGRIKASQSAENDDIARRFGVSLFSLQTHTAKLRDLEATCQHLLTIRKKQAILEKEDTLLREKSKKGQQIGIFGKPPYPLSFCDHIMDEITAAEQERETALLERRLAERALEDAGSRLQQVQKTLRGLREQLELSEPGKNSGRLGWDFQEGKLEVELSQAIVGFHKAELEVLQTQIRLAELKKEIGQQRLGWVRTHLHFDQTDLEKQLQGLEKERGELQKHLKRLLREQIEVESARLAAEGKMAEAKGKSQLAAASAFLKVREAWCHTHQRVLEQVEHMLHLLNQREEAWERRYELVKAEISHKQLDAWREDAKSQIKSIDGVLVLQQSRGSRLQSQLAALAKQGSEKDITPESRKHLQSQMRALQTLAERSLEYLSMLLSTKEVNSRLVDEIALRHEEIELGKKLLAVGDRAKDVWNFELWVIDDRAMTVRKIMIALLILVLGLFAVRCFIRVMRNRLLPRMNLEASSAAAFEKAVYYLGFLLVVLFALRMVNIPLTAFTFLGGAIAIGVGFGAQNLINNFISGFIIMGERPIKIGDLIEMEGNTAVVEDIGARCTRIRTAGNIHILVPNSSFLEKNITNRTLSDKMVRASVTLGAAYGSPVREVRRLMIEAALDHGNILKRPEPFVLFSEFGDNSLVFDLYFWITISRIMDQRIIESDIRFRIDKLFREAGIVIAFPQRDVHLDMTRPLECKILNPSGPTEKIEK